MISLCESIEHKPDLVVLDMMLPKLSGPDVLRALRKGPGTASIPVMVLTSLPQGNAQSSSVKEQLLISRNPGSIGTKDPGSS